MESALLEIVLDSSILIAAERRKMTADQAIENVQKTVGESVTLTRILGLNIIQL